jgi:biotin operon repressor
LRTSSVRNFLYAGPMIETSARLLRLLSLLQSRRYWEGAGLAERLEITSRTLRRDIDKLRSLGYTVSAAAGPGVAINWARVQRYPRCCWMTMRRSNSEPRNWALRQ